ncbi:MAG: glycosyltransferase family 4 protein [Gammaproteobacteria bacterium]
MKVLELCLSHGVGGLELYAAKVVKHYQSDNHVQCYAVTRKDSFLDKRLMNDGISTHHLRVLGRNLPVLAARKLASMMETWQIDVLHMHWGKDLLLAALAKRFCRRNIRLVYTRQMAISRDKHDAYHRFVYRYVDCYITITRLLQEQARKNLPLSPENIELLYYGVPAADVTADTSCAGFNRDAKIRPEAFKVGLFGRIEEGKGQHLLLEAIRQLSSKGYDIQGLLIGHAMDKAYLDNLLTKADENGLTNNFRYFGFHPQPTSIMGCFDVVVLASNAETFGLVLAEAMRAGTAVIGTNAGGVPEIIDHGETGYLFAEPMRAGSWKLSIMEKPVICLHQGVALSWLVI